MKKSLIVTAISLVVFALAFSALLKFPPWAIGSALSVATGLGAKIGCSHYFISGFEPQRIIDDLATYSPATRMVDLTFDDQKRQVSAEIFGLREISATFRPGLGCSFDHPDSQVLDSVEIKSVKLSGAPWPKGELVDTIIPEAQTKLDDALMVDNQQGQDTRALLVLKQGDIIAESYAPGFNKDTRLLGWSMGKSITAMLIGSLVQESKLSLNEKVLFASWKHDKRADISVKHMLTMTDGLGFDETYTPGSDSTKMLFGAPSASEVAKAAPFESEAGTHFSYSSGTTNLLAKLVFERAGNSPQANYDFFHSRMLKPMGLANTIFEVDSTGAFVGSSYIYATARDWARFGYVLANNGEINGVQVLSEEYIEQMPQPNGAENDPSYGYQVWLNSGKGSLNWPSLPDDAYAMRGNRGQIVLIIPSLQVVIVRLGWSSDHYPLEEKMVPLLSAALNR